MKKMLVSLLSILLCMTMVLSFAACGEEEKKEETKNEAVATTAATTPTTKAPVAEPEEDEPVIDEPVIDEPTEDSIVGVWTGSLDIAPALIEGMAAQGIEMELDSLVFEVSYDFKADGTFTIAFNEEALIPQIPAYVEALAGAMGMDYESMIAQSGVSEEEFQQQVIEGFAQSIGVVDSLVMNYEYDGSSVTMEVNGVSSALPVELDGDTLTIDNNGLIWTFTRQ